MNETVLQNGAQAPGIDDPQEDTLTAILAQRTDAGAVAHTWRTIALCTSAGSICALALALGLWVFRPDVVPVVVPFLVDEAGVVRQSGEPVALANFTVQERQWTQMLHQFVLHLRWRGLDAVQAQGAVAWLELHVCGEAVAWLERYKDLEEPTEHIGVRKREVQNIVIDTTHIPGMFSLSWTERFIDGPQQPITTTQTITATVARRPWAPALQYINNFALCVRSVGGLTL